jgi:nucleotide-binding universal stress UspA family protein
MSATTQRYRIAIALDDSEYAELVLEHALDQAARHDAPELHFLEVVDCLGDVDAAKTRIATLALEGLDSFRAGRPDWRTHLHVRVGRPADEIVDLAGEVDADLLVIGRYGVHDRRGSIADTVIAASPCPVLVIAGIPGHVVVPTCVDCAAVREESAGERMFCDAHTGQNRLRISTLLPSATSRSAGGLIW